MISRPTVLILGAGASSQYGFPLGYQLRENILALSSHEHPVLSSSGIISHSDVSDFCRDFRNSRIASIDAFLAVRTEYSDTGKKAIAAWILHHEENTKTRLLEGHINGWYDYLWNKLASGIPWNELSFSNLSIVTFNYDRSLEAFLVQAIEATYGVNTDVASQKLQELKIVHVYGDVGPSTSLQQGYSSYGIPITPDLVNLAVSRLKVIPEARDGEPTFLEAQKLLMDATAVCFLGFGFDTLNLRRLNAQVTCSPALIRADKGTIIRPVVASCLGQTIAEANENAKLCGFDHYSAMVGKMPVGFIVGDCLNTLRESLILQ